MTCFAIDPAALVKCQASQPNELCPSTILTSNLSLVIALNTDKVPPAFSCQSCKKSSTTRYIAHSPSFYLYMILLLYIQLLIIIFHIVCNRFCKLVRKL